MKKNSAYLIKEALAEIKEITVDEAKKMSNEVEQVESDPEIDDEHNELIGEHELIECEPEIIIDDEQFDLIDQEYSGSKKTKKSAHEETKLFKCSFCDKNYGYKCSSSCFAHSFKNKNCPGIL